MIAFDVFLNRKKLARAGMGSDGVLTAITTRVRLSSRSFCALAMRSSWAWMSDAIQPHSSTLKLTTNRKQDPMSPRFHCIAVSGDG